MAWISAGPISRRPEGFERREVLLHVLAQRPGVLVAELGFEREGVRLDAHGVRRTHVEAQESERRQIARAQHAVEAACSSACAGIAGAMASREAAPRGHRGQIVLHQHSISPARKIYQRLRAADNRTDPPDEAVGIDAVSLQPVRCAKSTSVHSGWRIRGLSVAHSPQRGFSFAVPRRIYAPLLREGTAIQQPGRSA